VLRRLELAGYAVVEEAATGPIALAHALGEDEPWRDPGFADQMVRLQRRRRDTAPATRRPRRPHRATGRRLILAEPPAEHGAARESHRPVSRP
jgi:hypothetical protein